MNTQKPTTATRPSPLPPHAEDFLQDLAANKSAGTVRTYGQSLKRCAESGVPLDVPGALDFARWLSARGGARWSLKTHLAAVSRFYHWLLREDIARFTAADMERLRDEFSEYLTGRDDQLPKLPSDAEVTTLLQAVRSATIEPTKNEGDLRRRQLEHLRDIAMLEALRSSGMRVGELVALHRGDLDGAHLSAIVTGKGRKQRVVYFDGKAWSAIKAYLDERKDGAKTAPLHIQPLFAQHGRRAGDQVLPLTTNRVRELMRDLCDSAKIEFAFTPHTLRHAFATRLLDSSGDLALVQDALGHSSPETTRIYAKVSSNKMREAHAAAFK